MAWGPRSKDPVFWTAPSALAQSAAVVGLAATPADLGLVLVSLAPASIPTSYGLLGVDLGVGFVLLNTVLPAAGSPELTIPLPPALAGTTLYFQGFAFGVDHAALSVVGSVLVP